MTFFLPTNVDPGAYTAQNPATAPPAGFLDILGAAASAEAIETDWWSQTENTRNDVLGEVIDRIGKDRLAGMINPVNLAEERVQGVVANLGATSTPNAGDASTFEQFEDQQIFDALATLQAEDPAQWGDITVNSIEALEAETNRRLQAEWQDAQDTLNMGGTGSGIAEFLARGTVAMTDPTSLALMPFGGGGAALRVIGKEALLGATGEALVLPRMYEQAERLDIPDPDPTQQIALGAVFGGGFAGLVAGVAAGYRRFNEYRAGRNQKQAEDTPANEAQVRDTEAALQNDAPIPATPQRQIEIEYELEGKIRSLPVSDNFQARLNSVVAPLGDDIGVILTSGGQAPYGSGGPRTGSTRHDVDASGFAHTADLVLTRNGQKVTPGEDPELYARFFQNAAAVFPGIGHYEWGVHVGSGPVAAWGPDTTRRSLDPYFGQAIAAGRTGEPFDTPSPSFSNSNRPHLANTPPANTPPASTPPPTGTRAGYTAPNQVSTPSGTRIEVEYEVVDASLLTRASGELQPRDRSRAASDAQITQMAAELDPARLMPSAEADRGAPIVGADNVVESGNGRVAAIKKAAPDRKAAYRAAITEAGFEVPEGMADPVLIARRTSELSDAARIDFVNDANTSAIARMSATEQAAQDARALSSHAMAQYTPGKAISAPENTTFSRAFLANLPANERAALTTAEGRLNLDGERRLKQALFARAYGAPDLIAKHAEASDPAMRSLIDALAEAAPAWSALRADIEAGLIKPEMDLTDHLLDAVRLIGNARKAASKGGTSTAGAIDDALAQIDLDGAIHPLTEAIVQVFRKGDRVRPDHEITELLNNYTNEARIVGKTDAALFDDELSSGAMEVLDAIQKETELFAPGGPGTRPRDESLYRQPNRQAAASRSQQTDAPLDTSQINEQSYIDGAQSEGSVVADRQGLADMRESLTEDFEIIGPDGQTYRASEILDDLEADADVAEIINLCNPKGGA